MDPTPAFDRASGEPRAPSGVSWIRSPAWLFIALAATVAVAGLVIAPLDLMPSELWAFRPLQLADSVATVLLGAVLFIRRPDAWTTCRPLVGAVVLLAVGTLLETAGSVAVQILWTAAVYLDPGYASWTILGISHVGASLGVLGIALVWLGLRRSIRHLDEQGLGRLAVVLWASTLLVAVGRLASTVQALDLAEASIATATVVSFAISVAMLLTLTAFTVTTVKGARAGEQPASAWWMAAASGLVVILGQWLVTVLGLAVDEPWVLFVVPQMVRLVSTLLLLAALALGLPSAGPRAPTRH